MKITILAPQNEFTPKQQQRLCQLAEVVYTKARQEYSQTDLIALAKDSTILAADPEAFGGCEKAMEGRFTELMDSLPDLKGVALSSTSYSWIDLDYCQKREIVVTNVPHYSTESVAEHVLGLLLSLAKKIIVSDRRTQQDQYRLDLGFELRGKTLGVIGLGDIGSRVAELGQAIGMRVIAYNRSPKSQAGVEMKTLEAVLTEADAISINVAYSKKTDNMIGKEEIKKMRSGAIVVNLATREIVDEQAMKLALENKQVTAYAFEGEDLDNTPLSELETAIALKPFAWYTEQALQRAAKIWTESIISIAQDKPINIVNL